MAKPPATAVSKNDFLASVPSLERRLFLCRFTPFHLRFSDLLPVFRDNKARGGIRRNGSKDLSRVSGRAVFVPEGQTGPFQGPRNSNRTQRAFFAGRSNVPVPWDTLILSVVLFVVFPLAGGMLTRSAVIKRKGQCTLRRLSSVCLTVQLPLAYC